VTAPSDAPRVCFVAAIPLSLTAFMAPHVRRLAEECQVMLVASGKPPATSSLGGSQVRFETVSIHRAIAPWHDVQALIRLILLFRRCRVDVVQSITPKAGLLAMVGARLAGVPIRIHWFTGQVWATRRGPSRWLLKALDRILANSATHLLADSESQRAFLVSERIVPTGRVVVIGRGSVSGVDTMRFRPDVDRRARVRAQFRVRDDEIVALYLGRLTRDKGLAELAEAWAQAAGACPGLHLALVGPDEGGTLAAITPRLAPFSSRWHIIDQTDEPEAYMAAADMLVLPSHREGFGTTVIEAAACAVPTIGTRIYGLQDAIADGISGLLVNKGDVPALAAAIARLSGDHELRLAMGRAARERAQADFRQEEVVSGYLQFCTPLLEMARAMRT
jgi:glycosyltransferase involved in cell wall biosynthesis